MGQLNNKHIDIKSYAERLALFERDKLKLPPKPPEEYTKAVKQLADRYNV